MAKSEQILNKLLRQIAKEQDFVNYDLKVEPISSGGANYTSSLHNITISEGDKVVHMFAKVAAVGEAMRAQGPKFFITENFAYTKLLKIYDQLQDEHQVQQEHRLVFPKFYGSIDEVYEETIVLENLVKKGYQAYDRFKTIEWEYAQAALRELAKMHALAFAYSEYRSEEFNGVLEILKFEFDIENEMMVTYFDKVIAKAIDIIRVDNKDLLQRYFEKFDKSMFLEYYKWTKRPVLGHGDFRPSNLMHRIKKDGTVDIKIVDLQTMQGNSPIVDLLYFIFTGSDEQFRAQYYEKLLDHYYTQLHAAMKRLHLDPEKVYSREDFDHELKEKLPFGLTIAVFTLPVVTVETENAPQVNEDLELSAFSVEKTSALYTERLNGVVNDYVRWGVLK